MNTKRGFSTGQAILVVLILIVVVVIAVLATTGSEEREDQANSFAGQVDYSIIGIEPGAGVMTSTEKALTQYSLSDWTLKTSNAASMLSALQEAVKNQDPIIVTAWEPHSAFAVANLRKLDDPKNIYNDPQATQAFLAEHAPEWENATVTSDVLASVVYKGFAADAPAADEFLRNFQISASTQSQWIYNFNIKEMEASEVAARWIENNRDLVDSWKPSEAAELGKEKLTIGIPPWPGATVKSRVVRDVLEEIGYDVEVKEMDAGVVYTSLADKQLDMTVAGWLPTTHQDYWKEKGGQLEIAGINVTTTWLGLAVPDYVDENIQSLSDLKQQ